MQSIHLPDSRPAGPLFDAHAHLFPSRIAEKAVEAIGDFYGLQMAGNGTPVDLNARCRKAGVTHVLICSTATHPGQADSINQFMSETGMTNRQARMTGQALPSYIPFGTAFPGSDFHAIRQDVQQVLNLGLSGIKLHPDFQRIEADDEGVYELCRVLDGRLPILIHAGDHRTVNSTPQKIARLAKAFPHQTIIAAHFGGWSVWPHVLGHLADLPNVLVDSSSSLMLLSRSEAIRLIGGFGADRVLFGTDYPAEDPFEELNRFMMLPLSEGERQAILYRNAFRLFGLMHP